MRIILLLVQIFLIALLLFACTSKVARPEEAVDKSIQSKLKQTPADNSESIPGGWQVEWDKALKEGKREGKVVIGGSIRPVLRDELTKVFPEKFGIEVQVLAGDGGQVVRKLQAERNAGLYLADVYLGGTTTMILQMKPIGMVEPLDKVLILPDVIKPDVWWGGGLRWIDKEHTTLAFMAYPSVPLGINTEIVKAGEIKSYKDLLDTKWKGKIAMFDPTITGMGAKIFGVMGEKVLGMDYWYQLIKQEPLITRDHRQMTEWLARGKVAVTISAEPEIFGEFIRAGAPIKAITPSEGTYLTSGTGSLSLIQNPAHPNAAKVFINWLLSREGQTIASQKMAIQSARLDVPTEHLNPDYVRQPDVKYIISDDEELLLKQGAQMKQAEEIFKTLLK